jgi:hypothetical protein
MLGIGLMILGCSSFATGLAATFGTPFVARLAPTPTKAFTPSASCA